MAEQSQKDWEPKDHAENGVACSECGLTMAQAKMLATGNTELLDAKKQIRILENWQETVRSASMLVMQRDRAVTDLTAEQEITRKLVKVLKLAVDPYEAFPSDVLEEIAPDWLYPAREALAELEALRVKKG